MLVCTAEQMRELDRCAIEDYGIPGVVLMEVAGRAVVDLICRERPPQTARVVVCCGGGNNGGDGFVIARHLLGRGATVTVCSLAPRERIGGDAAANLAVLERMQADLRFVLDADALASVDPELERATVIVDALLGTGLNSALGGNYRLLVERLNRAQGLRVAVDLPTGLHADTGETLGTVFRADHTVTFGYPKLGLVTHPGVEAVGQLHVADIGIPPQLERSKPFAARVLDAPDIARRLPARPVGGHKGTFGHLLIIGGSVGKSGAALLCAQSALRAGAGLCTIACPPAVLPALECKTREEMLAPLLPPNVPELDDSDELFDHLTALLQGKAAIAIGPGLPPGVGTERFMARLLRQLEDRPLLIDADGLNALAGQVDVLRGARTPVLLTPHPGEMGRLLGSSAAEVQRRRVPAARDLAQTSGAFVALKGARTVVATPDGQVAINPTGNAGMGSGGTGDALTGIAGALLAQGLSASHALEVGVYVHGAAGDAAAQRVGERGLVASDLIAEVGPVLRSISGNGSGRRCQSSL